MSRAKQRADRIREVVPIIQVLADYGYHVNAAGDDREQQFSCDLHGDGSDGKPSARAYPSSNSWYCFACGRPRDAIQTCREKEGHDFWAAIKILEARYRLPALPWEDEVEAPHVNTLNENLKDSLRSDYTYEEERTRVERFLQIATEEREVPMMTVLAMWEAFDRLVFDVKEGHLTENRGKAAFESLIQKAMVLFGGASA